jgi:hypothetical protein
VFLVSHSLDNRAKEIRSWLGKHPSVALVVAGVYLEWTLCRALVGLSKRPNKVVRASLGNVFGLDKYKDFWRDELRHLPSAKTLVEVVNNWQALKIAFESRNRLVHGRDRYTPNMARPEVELILAAVSNVCDYCKVHGLDINKRLPQRRQKRPEAL